MGGLAPLLASLLATDLRGFAQRTKRNAIIYAIVGLFLLTAYGTAVAALAVWLATKVSLAAALGIVALGALALALFLILFVMLKNRAEEKRRREAAAGNRAVMVTAALSALPILMKSRPLMAAAISGGAGLILLKMLGGGDDASDPGA